MFDLSIIIVTYNSAKDIGPCLDSIKRTKGNLDIEVLVVDNASKDKTIKIIQDHYRYVCLIRNDYNAGFPAANNQAIIKAEGRYILLLNPDTLVSLGVLEQLVSFMDETPACGVCGPQLIDGQHLPAPDLPKLTPMRCIINSLSLGFLRQKRFSCNAQECISGACLLFRSELIETVGLLDENLFWTEDVDFCVRAAKQGYNICKIPETVVIHYIGHSGQSNIGLMIEKQYVSKLKYFRKHRSSLFSLWLVAFIFLLQVLMRLTKWSAINLWSPDKHSTERIRTLKRLVREIPIALRDNTKEEKGHIGTYFHF